MPVKDVRIYRFEKSNFGTGDSVVTEIETEGKDIQITAISGGLQVKASGALASAEVYSISGMLLARAAATGTDSVTLNFSGQGTAVIVTVITESGNHISRKIFVNNCSN